MKNMTVSLFEFIREIVIPSVKANWAPPGIGNDPNTLIKSILNTILIIVVISAVIYIMFAGLQYVSSQGDAAKAKTAMGGITNAIIGLIVAFAAYVLVQLIMTQLGLGTIQNLPTVQGN